MNQPPVIHVVDDDASLREAMIELLHAAGFRARGYASTGEFLLEPPPMSQGAFCWMCICRARPGSICKPA